MTLQLRNLRLQHPGKPPLLENLDLSVERGDFVVIRGPSGCGKSTLLRVMCLLQPAAAGEILLDGRPTPSTEIPAARRHIAYLHQTPVTMAATVGEELLLPFSFAVARDSERPDAQNLRRQLDAIGLADVTLADDPGALSLGQKQRLALIRALLVKPRLLLCDEPTSALDPESRQTVERRLQTACAEDRLAIVIVTHTDLQCARLPTRRLHWQPAARRLCETVHAPGATEEQ